MLGAPWPRDIALGGGRRVQAGTSPEEPRQPEAPALRAHSGGRSGSATRASARGSAPGGGGGSGRGRGRGAGARKTSGIEKYGQDGGRGRLDLEPALWDPAFWGFNGRTNPIHRGWKSLGESPRNWFLGLHHVVDQLFLLSISPFRGLRFRESLPR